MINGYRRALHGARGLKRHCASDFEECFHRRALHGARGLKLEHPLQDALVSASRPSRGAWIETPSRAPRPAWTSRRALHGARGLKPIRPYNRRSDFWSRPSRGAWIETAGAAAPRSASSRRALHGARGLKRGPRRDGRQGGARRALHGARGLKRFVPELDELRIRSRPSRGAWIETRTSPRWASGRSVAPFTGRVD